MCQFTLVSHRLVAFPRSALAAFAEQELTTGKSHARSLSVSLLLPGSFRERQFTSVAVVGNGHVGACHDSQLPGIGYCEIELPDTGHS